MTSIAAVVSLFTSAASAGAPTDCDLVALKVSSVVDADGYTTSANLDTDGFDPDPLLVKQFETVRKGCVMAQVSLHTLVGWGFGDEFAAIQVTLDGQPMYGHTTACTIRSQFVPCVIMAGNVTQIDAHSYHLVLPEVDVGKHTIEVRFAGVDNNGSPAGAYVGGSVLSVHHQ